MLNGIMSHSRSLPGWLLTDFIFGSLGDSGAEVVSTNKLDSARHLQWAN